MAMLTFFHFVKHKKWLRLFRHYTLNLTLGLFFGFNFYDAKRYFVFYPAMVRGPLKNPWVSMGCADDSAVRFAIARPSGRGGVQKIFRLKRLFSSQSQ